MSRVALRFSLQSLGLSQLSRWMLTIEDFHPRRPLHSQMSALLLQLQLV